MANRSKQKGDRFERGLVETFNAYGMNAKRVPLSGAANGFKGDVLFECQGIPKRAECKSRKKGDFKTLRKWLGDNDVLALKSDHEEPLIVLRLTDYCILSGHE